MKEDKLIGTLGLLVAIIQPILAAIGINLPISAMIIALLGIVAGAFIKTANDKLLLSSAILILVVGSLALFQPFGNVISDIFKNITIFVAGYLVVPITKTILSEFGILK